MKNSEVIQHLNRRVEELERMNEILSRVALNLSAERKLEANDSYIKLLDGEGGKNDTNENRFIS